MLIAMKREIAVDRFDGESFEPTIQYVDDHISEIDPELARMTGEQMFLEHTNRGFDRLLKGMRDAANGDRDRARIKAQEKMDL